MQIIIDNLFQCFLSLLFAQLKFYFHLSFELVNMWKHNNQATSNIF